eukprot:10445201-Heterocapsa_arctica.AAC.1
MPYADVFLSPKKNNLQATTSTSATTSSGYYVSGLFLPMLREHARVLRKTSSLRVEGHFHAAHHLDLHPFD